jgi:hypothetical protein
MLPLVVFRMQKPIDRFRRAAVAERRVLVSDHPLEIPRRKNKYYPRGHGTSGERRRRTGSGN